ncbi:uncharacterized protein LOC132045209 [Lycium ferocissimum]|uniref:uncharacterized protein LOC132045209 n=1 Tax=Lycium ferocissimum TaxID=112874 RepID=UPI0028153B72|nr:uncharacterized protein LOC132045209 [Lycium ferocissimum]
MKNIGTQDHFQMVQFIEEYRPHNRIRLVLWKCPHEGCFKCNTAGASRVNLGLCSAVFCVRNERGDLVEAGARKLQDTTNIVAKASAIQDGLEYCISNHLVPVVIESDSLIMINIVEEIWDSPWKISVEVRKIKQWSNKGYVQFAHILREGIALADYLANMVFDFAGTIQIHSFQELPTAARKILNSDKSAMPYIMHSTYKVRELD